MVRNWIIDIKHELFHRRAPATTKEIADSVNRHMQSTFGMMSGPRLSFHMAQYYLGILYKKGEVERTDKGFGYFHQYAYKLTEDAASKWSEIPF